MLECSRLPQRRMAEELDSLARLIAVVHRLRAPGGCPWDREQTHQSLRSTMLEEAYEVLDAIDQGSISNLREELGDVLLQVLMQAEIAKESDEFSLEEVANGVHDKLVRRHPHVFGEVKVSGAEEVVRNWEALKTAEYQRESALDGVQRSLPALQWAWSLQRRAANVGFDWPDLDGVLDKVGEELEELRHAASPAEREAEFGDLLFTMVNVGRRMGFNAEDALRGAAGRFEARFRLMEAALRAEGRAIDGLPLEELDRYWESAKGGEPG